MRPPVYRRRNEVGPNLQPILRNLLTTKQKKWREHIRKKTGLGFVQSNNGGVNSYNLRNNPGAHNEPKSVRLWSFTKNNPPANKLREIQRRVLEATGNFLKKPSRNSVRTLQSFRTVTRGAKRGKVPPGPLESVFRNKGLTNLMFKLSTGGTSKKQTKNKLKTAKVNATAFNNAVRAYLNGLPNHH